MQGDENAPAVPESAFRQKLRSQLGEKDAALKREEDLRTQEAQIADFRRQSAIWRGWYDADPAADVAVRWLSGVFGALIVALGLLWFLSFFGITVPLVSTVPIFLMIAGGSLLAFAVRRRRPAAGGR